MNNKEREDLADRLRAVEAKFGLCCGTVCDRARIAAELQSIIKTLDHRVPVTIKPDWANAPWWARWWAVDWDGCATWFELEPDRFCNRWCATLHTSRKSSRHDSAGSQKALVRDWEHTKTKRPG